MEQERQQIRLRVMTSFLFLALLAFPSGANAQVDSTLIRIRSTSVDSADAEFPLYFTVGYRDRAEGLSAVFASADQFLRDSLGVVADISVAVLAEQEWQQIWPGPYGVPYLSLSTPWVVVMPAAPQQSVMYDAMSQAVGDDGARTMIDNIGFHEVGHAYVTEYLYPKDGPRTPPLRWLDEFFAQYLAYAFISQLAPERAAVWDEYTQGTLEHFAPRFTSLSDFDAEYYGYLRSAEGTPNYAWYQSLFAERAAEVYGRRGIGFLSELKDRLQWEHFDEWTTETVLEQLDAIEPGFQLWQGGIGE